VSSDLPELSLSHSEKVGTPGGKNKEGLSEVRLLDGRVLDMFVLCFGQVNLSQCTKAVDPSLKPLCEQDVYLNEDPANVYKKLLCCDTCAVQNAKKRDLLPVYLAVLGTSVFAIILMFIIVVLASKYRAARKYVREIQEGRFGTYTFLP